MSKAKFIESNVKRYTPSISMGLSSSDVQNRIDNKLVNCSEKKLSKSYLSIFISNIFTFFNFLGLIVTIALIYAKAPLSSFFFDLIFGANVFIGIIQEIRAKQTIDKLSLVSSKTIKVIRDGKTTNIPSKDIVVDDIIELSIGSQIPTDSIILDGEIEVNESLLTGESVAIKKTVDDHIFAGSYIISGSCHVIAEKVGKDNYIEQLSIKAKKYKKPHSEIMSSLFLIIKFVGCIIVPVAILYLTKGILNHQDLNKIIQRTSAVVIGMIPSGMMLLTSMALAVGVIKLSRHNTLVQDLYSLEMLARVDTICFDKTGTITDGNMVVTDIVQLNNDTTFKAETIISNMLNCLNDTNQTATALLEKFGKSCDMVKEEILPFNSERKFCAVQFMGQGTFAYGAPDFLLSSEEYKKIEKQINNYASLGIRVILLAHSSSKIVDSKVNKDFTPLSLILIKDNIREDAFATVKWFKENDVDIKVISGDNPLTVAEVSKRVGITNADKYISLEGLSDEQVYEIANKYSIFGRVSPDQKAILIKSIRDAGHTTAMTGDGINDILAMKEADCAITVASGSDATKNVANLILTDNNFNSMPRIVQEGRRVINNIQSSASLYLMKTLFTMIFSFICLCIPSMVFYPYELNQMIMIEVFIIGLPSFFLSLQPNESRVRGKFINYVISKSLPSAILMILSVLFVKTVELIAPNVSDGFNTTLEVFAFTIAGLICLFFICKPLNKYRATLFISSAFVVLFIIIFSFVSGLKVLGYASFLPISNHLFQVIGLFIAIIIEIPISMALQFIFSKVNFDRKNKKI